MDCLSDFYLLPGLQFRDGYFIKTKDYGTENPNIVEDKGRRIEEIVTNGKGWRDDRKIIPEGMELSEQDLRTYLFLQEIRANERLVTHLCWIDGKYDGLFAVLPVPSGRQLERREFGGNFEDGSRPYWLITSGRRGCGMSVIHLASVDYRIRILQ